MQTLSGVLAQTRKNCDIKTCISALAQLQIAAPILVTVCESPALGQRKVFSVNLLSVLSNLDLFLNNFAGIAILEGDLNVFRARDHIFVLDRKSTRLNSSHAT